MQELLKQGISDYEMWDGIYKYDSAKQNINAAHKQIVEYAKLAEYPEVCIAEDDVKFFAPGAWEYFLVSKPEYFDIYLGSVYVGYIKEDNTVDDFCGMGLYIIHSRFYDEFLATSPHEHIDRSLTKKGKFVVCNPFVAAQYNGWSSNTGKDEKYDNLLSGRNLFGSK